MEKNLDLNDLKIDAFDIDQVPDGLTEFVEGHGLTEIGASSQTGPNSCGAGSCTCKLE